MLVASVKCGLYINYKNKPSTVDSEMDTVEDVSNSKNYWTRDDGLIDDNGIRDEDEIQALESLVLSRIEWFPHLSFPTYVGTRKRLALVIESVLLAVQEGTYSELYEEYSLDDLENGFEFQYMEQLYRDKAAEHVGGKDVNASFKEIPFVKGISLQPQVSASQARHFLTKVKNSETKTPPAAGIASHAVSKSDAGALFAAASVKNKDSKSMRKQPTYSPDNSKGHHSNFSCFDPEYTLVGHMDRVCSFQSAFDVSKAMFSPSTNKESKSKPSKISKKKNYQASDVGMTNSLCGNSSFWDGQKKKKIRWTDKSENNIKDFASPIAPTLKSNWDRKFKESSKSKSRKVFHQTCKIDKTTPGHLQAVPCISSVSLHTYTKHVINKRKYNESSYSELHGGLNQTNKSARAAEKQQLFSGDTKLSMWEGGKKRHKINWGSK